MLHEPGQPYPALESELAPKKTVVDPRAELSVFARLRAWFASGSWKTPLALFLCSFVVYSLFAFDRVKAPSKDTHFAYLANTYNSMIAASFSDEAAARRADKAAFELDRDPPHRNDWASYWEITMRDGEVVRGIWMDKIGAGRFELLDGRLMVLERQEIDRSKTKRRYFVSFPPGPAVLMMPFAAVSGYEINDVLWTIFFASLNVALLFVLLEALATGGRTGRSRSENLWLVALFALGSAHLWCSVLGQVWFTALIMGVSFTLLYLLSAIDARHPFWAGVFCALAFSTRTPLLFASLFFFLMVAFPGGERLERGDYGDALRRLAWFCLPCLVVGISLLVMNKVRFESLTEFGHVYLAGGQLERIKTYGLFHHRFLSRNLTAMFTLLPRITDKAPYLSISTHGMSLLLTSPALVWLLWPKKREGAQDKLWFRAAWIVVAACALPGIFYQNTGYAQFGFRFSLDYMPYLVLLLALGRQRLSLGFKICVVIGILVNAFGAVTFQRFTQFYATFFAW